MKQKNKNKKKVLKKKSQVNVPEPQRWTQGWAKYDGEMVPSWNNVTNWP